jgi:Ring finger domain
MRRSFLLSSSTLLLIAICHSVEGTITIVDTQQRFASRGDETYGRSLWKGYEYYARLQSLSENPSLCPKDDEEIRNITVTEPSDGLPVALLVQDGGGCHLEEKLQFALNHLEPEGVVRYLIVTVGSSVDEPLDEAVEAFSDASSYMIPWDYFRRRRGHEGSDKNSSSHIDVPFYILHITIASEYDLLNILLHESPDVIADGGPRIAMDSRHGIHGNSNLENSTLWTFLAAMIAACSCSLLLLLGSSDWDSEGASVTPAPVRPTRQRLTKEQVRNLFPIYRFDGQRLHRLATRRSPSLEGEALLPQSENHNDDDVLQTTEFDVCSICLDEYEVGDKLRVLPCHHAFHSKCVGKWLSERSAVCPLCKEDLFVPEEEEVEEEAEPNATSEAVVPTSSADETDGNAWSRFIALFTPTAATSPPPVMEVELHEPAAETATATPVVEPVATPRTARYTAAWWSRIFPSTSAAATDPVTTMLTEPLLSAQEEQVPDLEAAVAAIVTTVPQEAPTAEETRTIPPQSSDDAAASADARTCESPREEPILDALMPLPQPNGRQVSV